MNPGRRSAEHPRAAAGWETRQLAELLESIGSLEDESAIVEIGVERAVAILDAEVGALVRSGSVLAAVGFGEGERPDDELIAIAERGRGTIEVPAVGSCAAISVELEHERPLRLIVARLGRRAPGAEEKAVLTSIARVVGLGLRTLRLIENERSLRSQSQRQASENARLVAALRERQVLLERLSGIQRAIVGRRALHEVLDAVVQAACQQLGVEVGALRLRDRDDAEHAALVATVGPSPELLERGRRSRLEAGLGGQAMRERRLIATTDPDGEGAGVDFAATDLVAAIVTPVHEHDQVVGSLGVATREEGREFGPRDEQGLLAFAEHASLALNHARAVEEATHEAFHDSLTGLPNRALFLDRLRHAEARSEREDEPIGVLFVDLDGFKTVNDSLGHAAGDRLLVEVAERLRARVRDADTVARLGGDDFAILLEEMRDRQEAARAAVRILDGFEAPFPLRGRDFFVSASVGVATSGARPEELLRNADLAMFRAKSQGKGRYAVFEPAMHRTVVERLDLETDLKRVLERDELILHYQPVFALDGHAVAGLEALVRWQHPSRGLMVPEQFVPVAEEIGLIVPLGRWVLRTACRQAAIWRARYPAYPDLQVGVNLSGVQLREPRIVAEVDSALRDAQLDPPSLVLEITETVLMEDTEVSMARLDELKELGVRLAIDDFGTGYSSLRYLHRFPVDVLKIDQFFIDQLELPGGESALIRAIVELAEVFGLRVVAEGIERPGQAPALRDLGCEFGQGFHLAPPAPAADADSFLLGSGLLGPADPPVERDATPPAPPPAPTRRDDDPADPPPPRRLPPS